MIVVKTLFKTIIIFLINFLLCKQILAQKYSVRTNVLNLLAKGPSFATGIYLQDESQVLLTFSAGHFAPFLAEDYYRYSTVHIEYRKEDGYFLFGKSYFGSYVRYIHKRILSEGFTAGPYGIFSKEERNFKGHGMALGLTGGTEWQLNENWFIDYNVLFGAGKYLAQIDYTGHDKITLFPDIRVALQIGYTF